MDVAFPLTIRTAKESKDVALVFDNLIVQGYRIGFPSDQNLRQKILNVLKTAMLGFHSAGVVHMDFYPSNFMWKVDDTNNVLLKVVD